MKIYAKLVFGLMTLISLISSASQLDITIYNQNFAVIRGIREVNSTSPNKFIIQDIAESIIPDSVKVNSLSNPDFFVLEQNFEYDLVSTDKLLNKMIGKEIEVIIKGGRRFEGVLLSAEDYKFVIRDKNGLKVIDFNDNIEQIILPELGDKLLLQPVLMWRTKNAKNKEKLQITYQANKISWLANYNITLFPKSSKLNINGWVTVKNFSGTNFPKVHLKLVAGDVHKIKPEKGYGIKDKLQRALVVEAKSAGFKEREFFEYHLYDLPRKVNIKNNEIKQIELLDKKNVPYKTEYIFTGGEYYPLYREEENEEGHPLSVMITFENSKKNGLGIPLPAGTVRVYQFDKSGADHFIGQDKIDHTPKDEKVKVKLGRAYDVIGTRKVVQRKKVGPYEAYEDIEIRIRNHKHYSINVIVKEKLMGHTNWTIENNNLSYVKTDYRTIEFRFKLKGNSEQKISFRIHYRTFNW